MSIDFNWDLPYSSKRAPVFARNVVATSQPLASQAGIEVLRESGNAVDAALAAAITLTVVEPCSNGVGSDAFAQIYDGKQLHGYSGNGKSPAAWTPEHFSSYSEMPNTGWDSVVVPGAVQTWVDLHERFGTIPFERLFDRAIDYAENGFHVGQITAKLWQMSCERFREYTSFQNHFSTKGKAPNPGELFKRPDLAATLKLIAESKGEAFYRGELAQVIENQSKNEDGLLTAKDLSNHQGLWTQPLQMEYRDVVLHELPPSGQGLAALIALGLLKNLNNLESKNEASGQEEKESNVAQVPDLDSADWLHGQIEVMKIAIRAAFDHIADPDFSKDPTVWDRLLDETQLKSAVEHITDQSSNTLPIELPLSSDTVYLTAADASGRMVSFIQSNFQGFGSGIVIDGTGIAMQNRGAGFVLTPGHPNQVDGAKRPYHTIIPGFVSNSKGEPLASFGVMGGHMQHQGHVQMVNRIFEYLQNPQAASDAPRWYVSPDYEIYLEDGFSADTLFELASKGHAIRIGHDPNLFGGAQIIVKLKDGYCAASDHRKEGCALGF